MPAVDAYLDRVIEEEMPSLLEQLPRPVRIHVWGDPETNDRVREAQRLVAALSQRFETIAYQSFPPRDNYAFYPVIGVMGLDEAKSLDFGLRLIGLPDGVQITSLLAAIQSVAFRGMTSEPVTRIRLHRVEQPVVLELITSSEDEGGTLMAHQIFNLAVASQHVRSYLIMSDAFPQAVYGYSVKLLPHLAINKRVHLEGVVEETVVMDHIAAAVSTSRS